MENVTFNKNHDLILSFILNEFHYFTQYIIYSCIQIYLFSEGRDILINSKTKCSVLLMQIGAEKERKKEVKLFLYSES